MIMKPKFDVILQQALMEGISRGYTRAHKHDDDPTDETVIDRIYEEVMNSLYEYFDFTG